MVEIAITTGTVETERHRTAYLTAGPADGPLMIFAHGWPELGRVWRNQIEHFAVQGWRCVAPDMRGYGGSSVPTRIRDYSVRETTADLYELQDALGGTPAVWVGHDLGCAPMWMMAAHHPERCRGVASLCVTYFSRGNTLANMAAMVDRSLYPADRFPVGQRDYRLYHEAHRVHHPDDTTATEEIVRGFDDLARAGKILYAGLSNFPAWRALGLSVVAWSPLGGGILTGKYRKGETSRAEGFGGKVFQAENSPQRTAVIDALIAIGDELGKTPDQVAIAWVASHGAVPLIGPRSLAQLTSNLGALDTGLTDEQRCRLDDVSAIAQAPLRVDRA